MKWIIIIAFFAASCGKPKVWTCETAKGKYKVYNATPSEITKMERENAEFNMKCH